MRIAYSGNFTLPWCTEVHIARTLTDMGHEVVTIQENTATLDEVAVAVGGSPLFRGPAVDLYLVTRSWGWEPADWLLDIIEASHVRGIPTAGFHLDRFHGLGPDRWRRVETDPMFRCDFVFTADGDDDDEFSKRDVNHRWLPPGVLAAECYDAEPYDRATHPWDVAFVGSYGYHPEWPHRREMVERLRAVYGDRFCHVGGDDEADLPTMRGDDLNRFYATIPVIVGDSCHAHAGARYWSDRFPETWGRGGYLVFPDVDLLQEEVYADTEWAYPCWTVGDWDEMFQKIDDALGDAYHRDMMRGVVGGYVRSHQTYTQRMEQMLRVIEEER